MTDADDSDADKPSESQLLADVRSWMERTGYPLEMEVARTLRAEGAIVSQGARYADPETGTEREIDVVANLVTLTLPAGVDHDIRMVVECKAVSAPWVAFDGGSQASLLPDVELAELTTCKHCGLLHQGALDLLMSVPSAYGITMKRNTDKNERDPAYQAIRQVMAAATATKAIASREAVAQAKRRHKDWPTVWTLPVVVTQAPLVVASLDDDGGLGLEETDRVTVTLGPAMREGVTGALVVTRGSFPRLVRELRDIWLAAGPEGKTPAGWEDRCVV